MRGGAIGLGTANFVAGAYVYARGDFDKDAIEREDRNRWGGRD